MSKMSMRMIVVAAALAAFMAEPLVAGTGYAISGRVTIDNRTGSGFRVKSLTATYAGVFPEGVDVINTFTADVDWAGKTPSKVVFKLNGAASNVSTSANTAQKTYNMGSDLAYARSGAKNDLIVHAVAADGAVSSSSQLSLWGLQLPQWAISFETKKGPINWKMDRLTGKLTFYGEVGLFKTRPGGTVSIPEWIPEVGGKYGVEIHPLNFEWELSAQPRFGDGAGLTGSFDLSGKWGAEASCGTKRKGEVSATLSGAGEFYPQFKLTDVSAELAGKFTFLFPRVPLLCHWGCCHTGYCPYFQASIAPEVKGTVGLEEGEPSVIAGLRFKNAELELGITVAGTVGAGSEGSIYYIAGTIGGKPYIVLQFPPDASSCCWNEYIKKVAFDLVASAVFECGWWKWEEEWEFNLLTCPETAKTYLMASPARERQITLVQREYLKANEGYSMFPDERDEARLLSVGGLPGPITNVGTVPTPSIAATSDEGLLLFVYDANDKPTGQHQEIYYARWTGSDWTAHAPLTDNTHPDLYPTAAIAPDSSPLAVWVSAPQPSGAETGPRDILPGFEISFSKYDAGSALWTSPQALTDNAYVDILPWFDGSLDGALRICWIASATNAIPVWHDETIVPALDLMAADWNGATFDAPYLLAGGLSAVSPPSVCRTDTHEFMAYIADTDANSATADDREVTVRMREVGTAWGPDVPLTTDAISDTAAQVAVDALDIPVVVWVKRMVPTPLPDGNDTHVDQLWFAVWDGSNWSEPMLAVEAPGIAEPKLIRNEAGRLIVFWVAASKEFSDIYYSAYDSQLMLWSQPQQVTHDQGAETMISLAESGGNILAAYVKRRIDLSDPDRPPQIGLSDIYLMEHVPSRDLFIGPNDISVDIRFNMAGLAEFSSYWLDEACILDANCAAADFDGDGVVDFNDYVLFARDRGRVADITAAIHLAGDFIVEDVNVNFYDGEPAGGVLIGSQTITMLLPGRATPVVQKWYVPADGRSHDIYAVVDPNNDIAETDDELNNTAFVTLFKPDLQPGSAVVIGYPAADSVLIGLSIENVGEGTADPFAVQVRKGGVEGEVICAAVVGPIEAGSSALTQFAWDVSAEAAGQYTLFVVADVNDEVAESREDNNVASGQAAVLADLEALQWSGRIEAGTAYITVRNIGAKPSLPTTVKATSEDQLLGTGTVAAVNPGASVEVSFAITDPAPGAVVELTVNPDSDGSDEVTLLNNMAIVIR